MKPKTRKRSTLTAAREAAGMTQEQLAEATGVGRAHLSLVETGASGLSAEKAVALASALGIDVADVLRKDEA